MPPTRESKAECTRNEGGNDFEAPLEIVPLVISGNAVLGDWKGDFIRRMAKGGAYVTSLDPLVVRRIVQNVGKGLIFDDRSLFPFFVSICNPCE